MISFEELGLRSEVLDAIADLGYKQPSEIQAKAIPLLLGGNRDFVGLAQTGTGKTAAFGLPLASLLDFSSKSIQALVICPTRELCLQIANDINSFTAHFPQRRVVAVYGGASIDTQLRELKRGAQVIVATPGRLLDFLNRKALDFSLVRYAVLDEADEMLNMGFKEDLDQILEYTPTTKNTWLFSATMPREVAMISKNYMVDPVEVTVGSKNSSASTITHKYFLIHDSHKYMALKRILDFTPDIYGIIFCQTRNHTRDIADMLSRDGYDADALHGDLSQAQRDSVMRRFRERNLQILVATDVAARGIDVDDITHVIHYSVPDEVENYTHRSGRTGRAGKLGISMALISPRDARKVPLIEKIIGRKLEHEQIPTGRDVCERQLLSLVDRVKATEVKEREIGPFLDQIFSAFSDLTKEELITQFISAEFNKFLHYYKGAADLNLPLGKVKMPRDGKDSRDSRDGGRPERAGRTDDDQYQNIFINVGMMDGLDKGFLVRFICDNAKVTSKAIGRIDIKREFAFVAIDKNQVEHVMNSLNGADFEGRSVRTEITKNNASGGDRGGSRGGFEGGGNRRSYGGGSGKPSGGGYSGRSSGGSRGESGSGSPDGSRKRQFSNSRTSNK